MPSRLFPGWWVVLGCASGIAFGSAVFTAAAFPQLSHAWAVDFGWSQAELARAASIYLLIHVVMSPLAGVATDRWGTRRVACASIIGFSLALFALSRMSNSLAQLYAAFAAASVLSVGTNVVSYARALSLWFDRKRGLALGLAAGSQAVGAVLMPILAAYLIRVAHWQSAVSALAVLELVVCLPLVFLLVKDSPAPQGLHADGAPAPAQAPKAMLTGYAKGQVLRTGRFWRLALAFITMGMAFYAININVVFIFEKLAGMAPEQVARVQAIAGAAVLLGRIGFGYLLDRMHAPFVGIVAVLFAALGMILYVCTRDPLLLQFGAILIGASIGGESDLLPYLASRYFGTRALSSVFGWFLGAFLIGGAIGPTAFASLADALGAVQVPMYALIGLQAVPLLVFLTLGRYPSAQAFADIDRRAAVATGGP